jgi:hypothetical protein
MLWLFKRHGIFAATHLERLAKVLAAGPNRYKLAVKNLQ